MYITDIRRMDDKRYCLYIDYEPYCFVYDSDIKRLKLDVEKEIDDAKIIAFRRDYLYKRAMSKAVNSIKFSDKCENDIKIKLKELYFDSDIINTTIIKLKEYGYLDDLRYASSYIRRNINKKSKKSIIYELHNKRIASDIINQAFNMQDLPDERETVLAILRKRYTRDDVINNTDRVKAYLSSKGFSMRTSIECISDFCK